MKESTKHAMLGVALVLLLCLTGYIEQRDFELTQAVAENRK